MKIIPFLDALAAPTPTAPTARRAVLAQLARAGASAVATALPLAAVARPTETSFDVVTLLFLLERTQLALYTQGLAANIFPGPLLPDFQRLQTHQLQHVATWNQALIDTGAVVPPLPTFDFSVRRNVASNPVLFPNVLTNFDNFLQMAQRLEDAGVRIYESLMTNLVSSRLLFTTALGIQAVEARHAAHIRTLRRARGAQVKSWPSSADAPLPIPTNASAADMATLRAVVAGEDNGRQLLPGPAVVPFSDFLLLRDNTAVRDSALTEAFDEPLIANGSQSATAVVQNFLALFS
jgi:hypothetical protein